MATGTTKKKVTLPTVENTADVFDSDSPDLQECLSDEEDLISMDLELLDPEDNGAEIKTLAAVFPNVLVSLNEAAKDPEPNPERITELKGLTDVEDIEMYIVYYKNLCRHRLKIYNHGRLILRKLLAKEYSQVELDDLLYYTENSKVFLDFVHAKLVNMYDITDGQKRSFSSGMKNLFSAINYLKAAVDNAKRARPELHATQNTAIGKSTPQMSISIPTGSGIAQTGKRSGTGTYQGPNSSSATPSQDANLHRDGSFSGEQGGRGGPPNGENPLFQPAANDLSDPTAVLIQRLTDALSNIKPREDHKPNYRGIEIPKLDIFSGDASVYAHWKKKFLLLYSPDRNLPDAYLANVLHGLLQGEARRKVEIHFTADWNGDNYYRMWEHLDREYGSKHTQDRCIQDRAAQIPPLDSETLKSFGDFYDGITVQVNYYLVHQPFAVTDDNTHLYQQMRQKISDKLFLKFAEWSYIHIREGEPQRTLMTLQKWLLVRMEILRETETFSSSKNIRLSRSPTRSKQTGRIDPVEDKTDLDSDPNHAVIQTYQLGKQVRYNNKDEYYRYEPLPDELSHSASMCTSTKTNAVILQTLVCNLSGRKGRKGSKIVALLDPGSTQTFVDRNTAVKLKLKRTSKSLVMPVTVFNQQVNTDTYSVELHLTSSDGSYTTTITAYAVYDLAKHINVIDWSKEKNEFSHLVNVPIESLPSEQSVNLLIGYDHAALLESSERRTGTSGQPIARLTPLGWTCSVSPDKT